MDPLIADTSIVEVLEVFRVDLQGHCVVVDGLVVHAYADITVCSVWVAFACSAFLYLFGEVLDCLLEFLHLSVN